MATDLLILGGITFDNFDYSPPDSMMFGGEQAMKVHKLPGGSRVIDTLGPDDADITWNGFFFSPNAYAITQALDAMRAAGVPVPLMWGGSFRMVVVKHFEGRVRRIPNWVEYSITCTVASNPGLGVLDAIVSGIDALVGADLGAALAIGG